MSEKTWVDHSASLAPEDPQISHSITTQNTANATLDKVLSFVLMWEGSLLEEILNQDHFHPSVSDALLENRWYKAKGCKAKGYKAKRVTTGLLTASPTAERLLNQACCEQNSYFFHLHLQGWQQMSYSIKHTPRGASGNYCTQQNTVLHHVQCAGIMVALWILVDYWQNTDFL